MNKENKDHMIILQMSSSDLSGLLSNCVSPIWEQLALLQSKVENRSTEELLTRKQVAEIYQVSFVTLRDWEINNIIPHPIRKGARVYWRKSDIYNDINKKGGRNDK